MASERAPGHRILGAPGASKAVSASSSADAGAGAGASSSQSAATGSPQPPKKVPSWLNSRSWAAPSSPPPKPSPSESTPPSPSSSLLLSKQPSTSGSPSATTRHDTTASGTALGAGASAPGAAQGQGAPGSHGSVKPGSREEGHGAARVGAKPSAATSPDQPAAAGTGVPTEVHPGATKGHHRQEFASASAILAAATASDHIRSVPVGLGGPGGAPRPGVAIPAGIGATAPSLLKEPFTLITASAADHAYEKRINRFYAETSRAKVNLVELRKLAVHGIPNEGSLRAVTWKLLLGYLPVVRDDWEAEMAKKRAQYAQFVAELLQNPTEVERKRSREARLGHRATVDRWDCTVSEESIKGGKVVASAAGAAGRYAGGTPSGEEGEEGEEEEDELGEGGGEGRGAIGAATRDGEIELGHSTRGRGSGRGGGAPGVVSGVPVAGSALEVEDHPLSSSPSSLWHQFFQDTEIAEQIERDIRRTHPEMPFFMKEEEDIFTPAQEAMRRLLLIFAKLNPGIRYVQGMNEVLAPIIYVFMNDPEPDSKENAEADAFFCFVELLSDFRDFFCQQLDNSVVGIRSAISQLSDLLRTHDEELWRNLNVICKVDPQYYAFRWITLLLTQEFGFPQILRIWDAILGSPDGPMAMLLRVCCSMMMCIRDLLLAGDFTVNLKLLQKYPPSNVERILQTAERLQSPPM